MKNIRFGSTRDLKLKIRSRYSDATNECPDDVRLFNAIKETREQIETVDSMFNSIDDPLLIESSVFQLKALYVKYDFLLSLCKERGLTADFS